MTRPLDIQAKLTEQEWRIVCTLTDLQSTTSEAWRDLVVTADLSHLRGFVGDLRRILDKLDNLIP